MATLTASAALVMVGATGTPQREANGVQAFQATPKLVVLVVVDQLRGDMLSEYSEAFSGGFRKLLDEGFRFTRETHDHAVTSTAPGHATISTGVHPAKHRMVANEWYEIEDGALKPTFSVGDTSAPILGYSGYVGRSPANLAGGGVADWIEAADDDARIVSISRKDVAAINLAGKTKGEVYWLLQEFGKFATSKFYADRYPGWVVRFNEKILPDVYSDTVWESSIPDELLHLTRLDTSEWEGAPGHSAFPHIARAEMVTEGERGLNGWRHGTPFPDKAVLHMALEAVKERKLGQRDEVDFLALSFSQTDAMGHGYGPGSREHLDNLIRLDGLLGQLMTLLDEEVGEGNWVMALSSDHGVSDIPELLEPPVARLAVDDVREVLLKAQAVLVDDGTDGDVARRLAAALEPLPSIRRVFTVEELGVDEPVDSFARLLANSHVPERPVNQLAQFGVYIQWRPHSLVAPSWMTRRVGTDHRSAYYFDRWVPLIFYGAGVETGWSEGPVATVDIAPTLAALAGIATPDDLDGKVLLPTTP